MLLPSDMISRDLYSSPPLPQDAATNNPSLLVSWWCTIFSLVIIIVRLCGRWIRTEKMFMEDKIMALSIIPLLARMGCVHLVLKYGTNNALITHTLSDEEIWQRELGSKLVLPARIFYAAFLWIAKLTIVEFLHRMFLPMWKRNWETTLIAIRWFLIITFCGVVVATLVECQPFDHYWQVVPVPEAHCRQGFAQLITMGVSDTITDFALVVFPLPVIIASKMRLKRKISLSLLFGLSLILVAITIYRVYATIQRHSNQQFRSLVASLEILAAAAVSNALVLGSFVRDRGAKKPKFKFGSTGGESVLDRPASAKTRPRAALSWGSDIDLVSDLGIRLGPEFRREKSGIARPAPAVMPPMSPSEGVTPAPSSWTFPRESIETDETDLKARLSRNEDSISPLTTSVLTPRRMSFFDVGGLLEDDPPPRRRSTVSVAIPSRDTTFALSPPPHTSGLRQRSPRGIRGLLHDMGATHESPRERKSYQSTHSNTIPHPPD